MTTAKECVLSLSVPERCGGDDEEVNPTAEDVSRVDVHETNSVQILNVINEGIRSPKEVDYLSYGVSRPSTLLSLSLHSNRVSSLEGLASMTVSLYSIPGALLFPDVAFPCRVCVRIPINT